MTRTRLALPVLAAVAALAIAGCGGGGESSSELAGFAAPGSLVFVEGKLQPSGELKSNVDSIASKVAGVDSLGKLVVEKLEESARQDGEPVDFATEIEPWLGEDGALAFKTVDADNNPTELTMAIATTDPAATREFVDKRAEGGKQPYAEASYKGVEFEVGGSEDQAIGVVDDFLVVAESERVFKAAVDAWQGESLADEARFQDAISAASDGSLADVYLDLGALAKASEGEFEQQAEQLFQSAGVDLDEATAVASVIPQSDRVEVALSSQSGAEPPPDGDASKLIGSLPGNAFAAVGFAGFSDRLEESLDELDKEGIPGQIPPNQLKSTLQAMGIDLDELASSLEEGAVFAQGRSRDSLEGAMVLTSDSSEAAKTVANLGVLLRNTGTPGVTAVRSNGASGFSIHSEELGDKPLVVVSKGERVAVGYGLAPALAGLASEGETLSDRASYKAAVSALGGTPISAFADGPAALELAEALVPRSKEGFWEATPYLKKIEFIAMGSGSEGDLATARLIAGLKK
ncbi:MAG TPA: DUF3352 domain-containing protein [Solirubrobacterales bacterium]